MQKEKLSALIDGELVLSSLAQDRVLQQSWQSYHLIRDTLRGDVGQAVIHLVDIADRVAASLEKEATVGVSSVILESQPQSYIWQKIPFWKKVRAWVS